MRDQDHIFTVPKSVFSEEPEIVSGISSLIFQSRDNCDDDFHIRPRQNYFIVKICSESSTGVDERDWRFVLRASGDLVEEGNDPEHVKIAWVAVSKGNGRMMRP